MPRDIAPKNSYLLDLPGEIRNRIYDFAVEQPITYFPRRLKGYSDTQLARYGVIKQVPLYRSLAQTCRQLRTEYLPIYAATAVIHVCHFDLQEFMDAGCPLMFRDTREKIFGSMLLDWRSIYIGYTAKDDNWDGKLGPVVDILPFLKHCSNMPNMRVQSGFHSCKCCEPDWQRLKNTMDILLDIARRPGLRRWLIDTVNSVELSFPCDLSFKMGEGQMQNWMQTLMEEEAAPTGDQAYNSWIEDTGLDTSFEFVSFSD